MDKSELDYYIPTNHPLTQLAENQKPCARKTLRALPFAMQVADNPNVKGVIYGSKAMVASGAQQEFIAANMTQTSALKCAVILRAGDPPQYNKNRSAKSGVNLSKTSQQGFFKGAIAKELRFSRMDSYRNPLPHNKKDASNLLLKPTDPNYQHTMQLDINMGDIIRELRVGGDLKILGFDEHSSLLRLIYKKGRGPKRTAFHGQFTINLAQGRYNPLFYSRDWDRPDNDPNWDFEKKIIKKPRELEIVPDNIYNKVFENTFDLGYTEEQDANPAPSSIKKAEVFANRPRSAKEFKMAMGENHPFFNLIQQSKNLPELLENLRQQLTEEETHKTILEVYNKSGRIVAGDWDGLALGHPPSIIPQFAEVINVFKPGLEGFFNIKKLMSTTQEYLVEIQQQARQKETQGITISSFEKKVLSINHIRHITSEFALSRAGCITPHEFLFQQVLNDAYRDKTNTHYGSRYNHRVIQKAFDQLIQEGKNLAKDKIFVLARRILKQEAQTAHYKLSDTLLNKFAEHLCNNLSLALKNKGQKYILPHVHHDMNVHDLYQHGFDMRNPYGSNLEGAWLLITEDAGILYGKKQEQLIEVLLTGDFLEKNRIDINHEANWAVGWDRVIERQLALKQSIPEKTLKKYRNYIETQQGITISSSPASSP
ncbi:hypothetical protein ACD661_12220 [Legionella lytica]|uniref:Dot/Icm T4SS effector n=1 Tax=Legionella lytica TaxID=96232 RepID=A0ABW8DCN7_9GAMM